MDGNTPPSKERLDISHSGTHRKGPILKRKFPGSLSGLA